MWVIPINPWRQKTRDTGLHDGEGHILVHSLVLTQCWSVMDRRICRSMYSACKVLAKLALHACKNSFAVRCKKVKATCL